MNSINPIKTDSTLWNRKIQAFLHDPVFKAFDIQNHKKLADEFLNCAIEYKEFIDGSGDYQSSSMDRFPLPYQEKESKEKVYVNINEISSFLHPLSGSNLKIMDSVKEFYETNLEKEKRNLKKRLSEIRSFYPANTEEDYRKIFYHLWWELPSITPFSDFLPADTRAPNHSIIDHLDMTSAMEACRTKKILEPAFIQAAIGPVQKFIAGAKKTSDLWAGSYIFSYLTFQGMKVIGENLGFDNIIFPNMRNQYFVKKYLLDSGIKIGDFANDLPKDIASLPNRFLAVVPSNLSEELKEKIEAAVIKEWDEISNAAWEKIPKEYKLNNIPKEYWDMQIKTFPEFYCAIQKWEGSDNIKNTISASFKDSDISAYVKNIGIIKDNGGYNPTSGTFYPYNFELARRKLEAIKATTSFKPYIDERNVEGDSLSGDFKSIIEDYQDPFLDKKGEDLSAISLVKRFAPEIIREKTGVSKKNIPSTTEIAINNLKKEKREKWLDYVKKQDEESVRKLENLPAPYYSILSMDGDKMGKWISGENAPDIKNKLHEKAFKKLEELQNKGLNLDKMRRSSITPSFHKAVSRTLDHFSSFVKAVVEGKYEGFLVYAGGDDVLAFVPSSRVLECANDVRKVYSGIGNLEIEKNGKKYLFRDECCFEKTENKEIPLFSMMGNKASMSAGIVIVSHKYPLTDALQMSKKAEKYAKDHFERNSFAVSLIRHSGQQEFDGGKWDIIDSDSHAIVDFIQEGISVWEMLKNEKGRRKLIYELIEVDTKKEFSESEMKEFYIPFIMKRRLEMAVATRNTRFADKEGIIKKLTEIYSNTCVVDKFKSFLRFLLILEFTGREK